VVKTPIILKISKTTNSNFLYGKLQSIDDRIWKNYGSMTCNFIIHKDVDFDSNDVEILYYIFVSLK